MKRHGQRESIRRCDSYFRQPDNQAAISKRQHPDNGPDQANCHSERSEESQSIVDGRQKSIARDVGKPGLMLRISLQRFAQRDKRSNHRRYDYISFLPEALADLAVEVQGAAQVWVPVLAKVPEKDLAFSESLQPFAVGLIDAYGTADEVDVFLI
jgi:hypothetical protein